MSKVITKPKFNMNSNDHMSLLLFGGTIPKTDIIIKGLIKPKPEWKVKKEGFYQVNEKILLEILELHPRNKTAQDLISKILKIRKIEKQISTYYNSTKELTYSIDSCVHPNFNHTATDTGRLSCTKPNLQNQPGADE